MRNHGKRLVRRPCTFLKKLQKDREITDFTVFSGGDEGDRTLDLTDANRTLSQLSYAPRYEIVVGIELNRPGSQLSYAPTTRPL